jgi:hypothetical protein
MELQNKKKEKMQEKEHRIRLKEANTVKIESFKVNYKLNLIADEGAYIIFLDSKQPIG